MKSTIFDGMIWNFDLLVSSTVENFSISLSLVSVVSKMHYNKEVSNEEFLKEMYFNVVTIISSLLLHTNFSVNSLTRLETAFLFLN